MERRWVALDRLIDVIYPDLRRIARRHLLRRRAGESVESAALVNEAYLKLVGAGGIRCDAGTIRGADGVNIRGLSRWPPTRGSHG